MFRTPSAFKSNRSSHIRKGWLRVAAKAVEEEEEEDADDGVYGGGNEQGPVDPRLRLGQEQAARENDHRLMNDEEGHDQGKARGGMFRVQPGADGRGQIADHRFRDAVET